MHDIMHAAISFSVWSSYIKGGGPFQICLCIEYQNFNPYASNHREMHKWATFDEMLGQYRDFNWPYDTYKTASIVKIL